MKKRSISMLGTNRSGKSLSRNDLRQRQGGSRTIAVVTTVIGVATAAWALEETTKPAAGPQGLSGILPAEPPANLSADAFSVLGGTWAEWSTGAANTVAALYQSSSGDLAAQRQALASAKAKMKTLEKALNDRKYAKIAMPLAGLSNNLSRRVDLAEAMLNTLELDAATEYPKRLKAKGDAVKTAVSDLTSYLNSIANGSKWLPFVKASELVASMNYEAPAESGITAAKATKAKLASRNTLEDKRQKEFLSRSAFAKLETAVDQYLVMAENPPTPDSVAKLREQLAALVTGLEGYEATGQAANAAQARQAFSAIRKLAADGGDRISAALQKHYFNYNVRIVSSENFLARLLADSHSEQGQVTDYVLGANVSGWQTTNTTVGVDLKPSNNDAAWDLILNGNIQSNTQGVTSQATVSTQGNHTFRAAKPIRFDGTRFRTSPGTISVNANNTTTGVATQFSGGLFGGIADRIAMRETEARRGQAEAIAASRVEDRVLPRFNQEVDGAFVKAERDLQKDLYDHLRETKLYPDAMMLQTTDRDLRVGTRLMTEKELGGGSPPMQFVAGDGATLLVHESVMNNGADRLELAGKTMTDDEFRGHLEQFFSKALNRKFTIDVPQPEAGEDADEKPPGIFVFAPVDPIRIRLQDGSLSIIFRTGFKRENGDEIPQQIITVPLKFEVQGNKIRITRDTVQVQAAEGGDAGQIARAGIIRRKIQNTIPERVVDGAFTLKGTRQDVKAVATSIKIVDGWAVLNIK